MPTVVQWLIPNLIGDFSANVTGNLDTSSGFVCLEEKDMDHSSKHFLVWCFEREKCLDVWLLQIVQMAFPCTYIVSVVNSDCCSGQCYFLAWRI